MSKTRLAAFAFVIAIGAWTACAEDTPTPPPPTPDKESPEEKEAAAEEVEASKLQGEVPSALTGIPVEGHFTIIRTGEEKPVVLGSLKTKDKTYLLKVDNDEVRKTLSKCGGKDIAVFGKERNKGKYLIVLNVKDDGSGPPVRRKGRGF